MTKFALLAVFVLAFAGRAAAQSGSQFEAGGNVAFTTPGGESKSGRGWSGEFSRDVNAHIGFIGMFEKSTQAEALTTRLTRPTRLPGGTSLLPVADVMTEPQTTAGWLGVRVMTATKGRLRAFGRGLLGLASVKARPRVVELSSYDEAIVSSQLQGKERTTGPALLVGGGVQLALGESLAFNAALDWRNIRLAPLLEVDGSSRQNSIQTSAGLVFRFGRR